MNKPQHTRVAAYGLIHTETHMLLCRLSEQVKDYAGHWTLPGGGVDFGEDPRDAVVREDLEETGLDVVVDSVVATDSFYEERSDIEFHAIRIIYRVTVTGGTLRDEINGSTDTCAWLSREELAIFPLVSLAELGVQLCFGDEALHQ